MLELSRQFCEDVVCDLLTLTFVIKCRFEKFKDVSLGLLFLDYVLVDPAKLIIRLDYLKDFPFHLLSNKGCIIDAHNLADDLVKALFEGGGLLLCNMAQIQYGLACSLIHLFYKLMIECKNSRFM